MAKKSNPEQIARYADMLSAMGTEPRLRIMQLLLSAHPQGMVVGEIGGELEIPSSTLSHHLEKLKNEGLVKVRREGTFLCIRPIRKGFGNFSAFYMPNAAPGTRPLSRKRLSPAAERTKP